MTLRWETFRPCRKCFQYTTCQHYSISTASITAVRVRWQADGLRADGGSVATRMSKTTFMKHLLHHSHLPGSAQAKPVELERKLVVGVGCSHWPLYHKTFRKLSALMTQRSTRILDTLKRICGMMRISSALSSVNYCWSSSESKHYQ